MFLEGSLRPATLLKIEVFPCEFCEISQNTILHRTPLVVASIFVFRSVAFLNQQLDLMAISLTNHPTTISTPAADVSYYGFS